jgi:starch synthase (maltosyl-transferring)
MKPTEGRRRVIIESVQPSIDAGRYPAKRILGDTVTVTAAIFADGHDHIAARLLYRHLSERDWHHTPFTPINNDLWFANFPVTELGKYLFTIEAWIDHLDTWRSDFTKRLTAWNDASKAGAPPSPTAPSSAKVGPTPEAIATLRSDVSVSLLIGANYLDAAAARAKGIDAATLKSAAAQLRAHSEDPSPTLISPIDDTTAALANQYHDTALLTRYPTELPLWVDRERARFSAWYEVFPRSASNDPNRHGTFADVELLLPEIAALGFDILYMPPIHPIGRAYRKGKNNAVTAQPGDVGSPWAIGAAEGGHTDILPELGTLDDFKHLLEAARTHGLELALDIAFQCSPDHPWVKSHPDWFLHRPDGTIQYAENPPKKYQDIYPLNFESSNWRGLWDALRNVFEFWIDHGVRVFRVDNPHTKALPFWEWCITEIQKTAPDVLFLAEAFTRPHVMYSLAKAGYSQGYTYFTWRQTKAELTAYFTELSTPPVSNYFRGNVWPNTPDILHEQLQVPDPATRRAVFQQRAILAATLSSNWGIYGPAYELCEGRPAKPAPGKTASEEYLDSEKYQLRQWDRSDPISIAPLIARLNQIRRAHPALQRNERLTFHTIPNDNLLAYSKSSADGDTILTIVNLDPINEQSAILTLDLTDLHLNPTTPYQVEDLLTGTTYTWQGPNNYIALRPKEMPAHIFRIMSA